MYLISHPSLINQLGKPIIHSEIPYIQSKIVCKSLIINGKIMSFRGCLVIRHSTVAELEINGTHVEFDTRMGGKEKLKKLHCMA